MSAEKLPFILPAVFTIGPELDDNVNNDDQNHLLLYAKLIAPLHQTANHVKELVKGVIEGETRVLAAGMTMEEIFKGTKEFKKSVFDQVQMELNQFGLIIYNANVKQLVDVRGHEYFSYLGQKTQQGAANQAKVDVAEARMKGEGGADAAERGQGRRRDEGIVGAAAGSRRMKGRPTSPRRRLCWRRSRGGHALTNISFGFRNGTLPALLPYYI